MDTVAHLLSLLQTQPGYAGKRQLRFQNRDGNAEERGERCVEDEAAFEGLWIDQSLGLRWWRLGSRIRRKAFGKRSAWWRIGYVDIWAAGRVFLVYTEELQAKNKEINKRFRIYQKCEEWNSPSSAWILSPVPRNRTRHLVCPLWVKSFEHGAWISDREKAKRRRIARGCTSS